MALFEILTFGQTPDELYESFVRTGNPIIVMMKRFFDVSIADDDRRASAATKSRVHNAVIDRAKRVADADRPPITEARLQLSLLSKNIRQGCPRFPQRQLVVNCLITAVQVHGKTLENPHTQVTVESQIVFTEIVQILGEGDCDR